MSADYRDELWDILEHYSETGLFRDWNIARVNKQLTAFESDLLELHAKHQPPLYRLNGNA